MTRGFVDSRRFKPVFAVEVDPKAAATYEANFGLHVQIKRIEEVDVFPQVDVVVGGPPCQAFSTLNRHQAGFERRALWREYVEALKQADPIAFVMENVPQLLGSAEYRAFATTAKGLGYSVEETVLNAADFGVPQRRRRAIVIGTKFGTVPWPVQTHYDPSCAPTAASRWITFRAAVKGLPRKPTGKRWHVGRNPRPETLLRYKHVPHNGGNRFEMARNLDDAGLSDLVLPCFRRKPTGTTDVFGRLWWQRPAVTIRTEFYKPEKGRYLHPTEDRPITIREAARCMSFPDDFILPEDQSMTAIARQIGNAVPPLLARRIAEALAAALDDAGSTSCRPAAAA